MDHIKNMACRMFPLLFLLAIYLFSGCSMGTSKDGEWVDMYADALEQARKQKRQVFLLFYFSKGSAFSEKLEQDVLNSKEFKQYVAKRFVLVKLDFTNPSESTKAQSGSLMDRYRIQSYPTVVIVEPKGQGQGIAQLGYVHQNPATFMAELRAVPGPGETNFQRPASAPPAPVSPLQKVKGLLEGEDQKEASSTSKSTSTPVSPGKIVIEGYDSTPPVVSIPATQNPTHQPSSTGVRSGTNSIPAGQGSIIIEGYDPPSQ